MVACCLRMLNLERTGFYARTESPQRRLNSRGWGLVSAFQKASGEAEIPAVLSASPLLIDGVL